MSINLDMYHFFVSLCFKRRNMLPIEPTLPFSDHSSLYDILVPKTNLLRQINDLIDFSFIRSELLAKYSQDNGRTAECPIRMFKYLLLKIIYDLSDVDVVEHSLYDLSYKYFLGMVPEETSLINSSSLSKFRKLRLKDNDLMDLLIKKTVNIAVEKGIIKSRTIIVDSTHTCSRSNPYSPVDVLKLRSKQLRKSLYDTDDKVKESLPAKNEDNNLEHEMEYTRKLLESVSANEILVHVPKVKERLNMLKEVLGDIEDHYTTSKDTDARVGHKSEDDSFFGFKTHIAMSENASLQQLPSLLAKKATALSWKILWRRTVPTAWRLIRWLEIRPIRVRTTSSCHKMKRRDLNLWHGFILQSAMASERRRTSLISIRMPACLFVRPDIWLYARRDRARRTKEKTRP